MPRADRGYCEDWDNSLRQSVTLSSLARSEKGGCSLVSLMLCNIRTAPRASQVFQKLCSLAPTGRSTAIAWTFATGTGLISFFCE